MTLSRRTLLAAAASLLTARVGRADGAVDELFVRIARARAPLRTLQGPFTQTRTIALFATDVRSHGTLRLARPDRMRWELAPPDDVTFWVGPEGLAYRSAHGHGRLPAATARVGDALDDLRTLLGGDLALLARRWSLRVLRDDAGGAQIEATARTAGALGVQSMTFELGPDLVRPRRATLVGGTKDRTVVDFGELVVDSPIDESTMRPPP